MYQDYCLLGCASVSEEPVLTNYTVSSLKTVILMCTLVQKVLGEKSTQTLWYHVNFSL